MLFEGLSTDWTSGSTALLIPGESDHPQPEWSDHSAVAYDDDLDEDESYFLESDDEEDDDFADDEADDFDDDDDDSLDTDADQDDDDDL